MAVFFNACLKMANERGLSFLVDLKKRLVVTF